MNSSKNEAAPLLSSTQVTKREAFMRVMRVISEGYDKEKSIVDWIKHFETIGDNADNIKKLQGALETIRSDRARSSTNL